MAKEKQRVTDGRYSFKTTNDIKYDKLSDTGKELTSRSQYNRKDVNDAKYGYSYKKKTAVNKNDSASKQNYTKNKNVATDLYNSSVDDSKKMTKSFGHNMAKSIGAQISSNAKKVASKAVDAYANAYAKAMNVSDSKTSSTKTKSSLRKNARELYPNEPDIIAEKLYKYANNPAEVYEPSGVDNDYYQTLKASLKTNPYASRNKTTSTSKTKNKVVVNKKGK